MEDSRSEKSPEEDITLTADALKAMGHPLRWKILCTLGNKEMSVGEVEFSGSTYQVQVGGFWAFLQLESKGNIKDCFCVS